MNDHEVSRPRQHAGDELRRGAEREHEHEHGLIAGPGPGLRSVPVFEPEVTPAARPEPGRRCELGVLGGDERGAVTAEFAIGISVVLLVLGLVVGGLLLAAHRIVLTSAAADVARLEARGDAEAAETRLDEVGSGTSAKRWQQGVLHCVRLSASPGEGALSAVGVSATACAASSDGGAP